MGFVRSSAAGDARTAHHARFPSPDLLLNSPMGASARRITTGAVLQALSSLRGDGEVTTVPICALNLSEEGVE